MRYLLAIITALLISTAVAQVHAAERTHRPNELEFELKYDVLLHGLTLRAAIEHNLGGNFWVQPSFTMAFRHPPSEFDLDAEIVLEWDTEFITPFILAHGGLANNEAVFGLAFGVRFGVEW